MPRTSRPERAPRAPWSRLAILATAALVAATLPSAAFDATAAQAAAPTVRAGGAVRTAAQPVPTTDTFDTTGTTIAGWTEARGDWNATSGTARLGSVTGGALLVRDAPQSGDAVSVSADIGHTSTTVAAWNGVATNISTDKGAGTYDFMTLRVKRGPGGGGWQLLRVIDGVVDESAVVDRGAVTLASTTAPIRLSLAATPTGGYALTITQSGTKLLDKTVTVAPEKRLVGGRSGLYSDGGYISADTVTISTTGTGATDAFTSADGATLASAWQARRGAWAVLGGRARATGGGIGEQTLVRSDVTLGGSFTISADVLADPGVYRRWNGVAVNVTDGNDSDYYALRYTPSSSASGTPAMWQLLRHDATIADQGTVEAGGTFAAAGASFDDAAPAHLVLGSDGLGGMTVSVSQKGVLFGSASVPLRMGLAVAGGKPALYSNGGYANFDDVRVATAGGSGFAFSDAFARTGAAGTLASQQLAGRWEEARGDWSVSAGVATLTTKAAGQHSLLLPLRPNQVDSAYAAAVTVTPAAATAKTWNGVAIHAAASSTNSTAESYYALEVAPAFGATPGAWRLVSVAGGTVTELHTGTAAITAGTAYTLRIAQTDPAAPNDVRISIRSGGTVTLAEQTKTLPSAGRLSGGRPGLVSHSGGATFDDFGYLAADQTVPTTPKPIVQAPEATTDDPATTRDETKTMVWTSSWTPNATSALSPYTAVNGSQSTAVPAVQVPGSNYSMSPVGQALYTTTTATGAPDKQYVGYYAADGRLTVAQRSMSNGVWGAFTAKAIGPADPATKTKSDTHNYIALSVSPDGQVHVAANMHASPLTYYRTTTPGNISTFVKSTPMVAAGQETHVTYPSFFLATTPTTSMFVFGYREGGSGDGAWRYNSYANGVWTAVNPPVAGASGDLFTSSSASGTTYNAYPINTSKPVVGPDGKFHLAWIWRDTGDASTNTRISYAWSADLKTWRGADGTIVGTPSDPIGFDDTAAIVDDVPQRGGAVNGLVTLGFDGTGTDARAVVAYERFDDVRPGTGADVAAQYHSGTGSNQFFVARFDQATGAWVRTQLTNYSGRWMPETDGAIPFAMGLGEVTTTKAPAGTLLLEYGYGARAGNFVLDKNTLEVVGESSKSWVTGWITSGPPDARMTWNTTRDASGYRVAGGQDAGGQYLMVHANFKLERCPFTDANGQYVLVKDANGVVVKDAQGNPIRATKSTDEVGPCDPTTGAIYDPSPQPMTVYLSK